jgi:hypothetical protein
MGRGNVTLFWQCMGLNDLLGPIAEFKMINVTTQNVLVT